MSDLNSCSFTGRLTKDAVVKTVGSNSTQLAEFDIANNTGFGEYTKTNYITCTFWGKRAVSVAPYLKKGTQAAVTGEVSTQTWTGKDGQEHTKLCLKTAEVALLGGGKKEGAEPPETASAGGGYADAEEAQAKWPY
jgi:single-strand DNA-binding protein